MQRPILIIGAMDTEIDFLINKLENLEKNKLNIYNIFKGNIKDYPVIIAQSEVGVINASSVTALAIEKYNPILIINNGTAGGYCKHIHRGDIVIGTECFNIMSVKTPYKERGKGSNSLEWQYISFMNGKKDEKKTKKADEKLINFIKDKKYNKGNIHFGIIGSGDVWNNEEDKIEYLNNKYGVICEEMEGIGVYTVANNYNIPAVGVRVISNNIILKEEYDKSTGEKCQEFVYKILKDLIQEINMINN